MSKSKLPMSDDDKAAFEKAMRGVKPLKSTGTAKPEHSPKRITVRHHDAFDEEAAFQYIPDRHEMTFNAEQLLHYRHISLPERTWQQLKKGQIPREWTLDLHGLTQKETQSTLIRFLHDAKQQRIRCVCIIHGKGQINPEKKPILKNLCYALLKQHPDVLAFHSALKKDGATGAVYVLLRTKARG